MLGGGGSKTPSRPAKILYKKTDSFQSPHSKARWGWGRVLSILIADCEGAKGPRKEAFRKFAVLSTFLVWRIKKNKTKRRSRGKAVPFGQPVLTAS